MTQHSFSIPNQGGAAFRADLNNALQALATISSGASAPASPYAYQAWYDTTAGLLKIRNGANTAWVIWGPVADSSQAAIYTNNLPRVYVDSTGKVGIGVPSPSVALDVLGDVNSSTDFKVGGVAIPKISNIFSVGTTTNTADAYVGTANVPISAYSTNQIFTAKINTANTTNAPTLNVSGLGAKTIKKIIGSKKIDVAIGDLQANMMALFDYDGTDLILLNPTILDVGCMLTQQTLQAIANNTDVALTFGSGSENWDDGAFHDTGSNTSRITPGFAGRGAFFGRVAFNTTAASLYILKLFKNGSVLVQTNYPINGSGAGQSIEIYHEDSFNSTDYYELVAAQLSGVSVNTTPSATKFSFRKL